MLFHLLWKTTILWSEAGLGGMCLFLSGRLRVKGRKKQMILGLSDTSISPNSAFLISYLGMQGTLSSLILPAWKRTSRRLRLQQLVGPFSGVCWSQLACRSWLCSSLLSALFSDVMVVAWNWPRGGIYAIEICKCYLPIRNPLPHWRLSLPAYHCPLSLTHVWRISASVQWNFTKPLTYQEPKMTNQNELGREKFSSYVIIKK